MAAGAAAGSGRHVGALATAGTVVCFGNAYHHWHAVWISALAKLPIALPFALATIVGGIDCTESAAAAGDEYDTRASSPDRSRGHAGGQRPGGVIQTTPYIGHPAYKTMGGRAGYTLATALFIRAAGYFGWFTNLFDWLPRAAMFPILVFVGVDITAHSFGATPRRHYAALAFAALPALAGLVAVPVAAVLAGAEPATASGKLLMLTLRCLSNGFIITSLLWAAALAALIDGRFRPAAAFFAVAGVCALFGIIHSPFPDGAVAWPGQVLAAMRARRRGTATTHAFCVNRRTTGLWRTDLWPVCSASCRWAGRRHPSSTPRKRRYRLSKDSARRTAQVQ